MGGILCTKEYYDILDQFEKNYKHRRIDREKDKNLWKSGNVYEDGHTNELFKAYLLGYSFGKTFYI